MLGRLPCQKRAMQARPPLVLNAQKVAFSPHRPQTLRQRESRAAPPGLCSADKLPEWPVRASDGYSLNPPQLPQLACWPSHQQDFLSPWGPRSSLKSRTAGSSSCAARPSRCGLAQCAAQSSPARSHGDGRTQLMWSCSCVQEPELKTAFAPYGNIQLVKVVRDKGGELIANPLQGGVVFIG